MLDSGLVKGNAALGRKTYQDALQLEVPDSDSLRQTVADTYLLWSRLEDEHGYVDEAKRMRMLGQQAASRAARSRAFARWHSRNLCPTLCQPLVLLS